MSIQKSICGNYIRVTVVDRSVVLTIGEWSKLIYNHGEFAHLMSVK